MYGAAFLLFLTLLVSGSSATYFRQAGAHHAQAQTAFDADQMPAYGLYVKRYAALNPTVTGSVANSSIAFPTWFAPSSVYRNYVAAGSAWVYIAPTTPARAFDISKYIRFTRLGSRARVGVVVGGKLQYPGEGLPKLVIPAAIPEGALVIAFL